MQKHELFEKIEILKKRADQYKQDVEEIKKNHGNVFNENDKNELLDDIKKAKKDYQRYFDLAEIIEDKEKIRILRDIFYVLDCAEAKAIFIDM